MKHFNILDFLYKLFMTLNATSLLVFVYLIGREVGIPCIPKWVSYLLYAAILVTLSWVSLLLNRFLSVDDIKKPVLSIEQANGTFLPVYLGYFFVALGIERLQVFVPVYIFIFIFTYVSQAQYFNPIFLLFGYHFYNVTTANATKIVIISKTKFRTGKDITFPRLRRITEFTFMEEAQASESFDGED